MNETEIFLTTYMYVMKVYVHYIKTIQTVYSYLLNIYKFMHLHCMCNPR